MNEIRIDTLSKFIEHIENIPKKGSWIYRGHKDLSYKLIPSIGRKQFLNNTIEKNETTLLKHFKDSLPSAISNTPKDDWDLIAMAQHYGLPTRLLDWSYNPLVGLFFAVEDYHEDDSIVYAINLIDEIDKLNETPFSLKKIKRFTPPFISDRINGQNSCFTVHSNPKIEFSPKDGFKYIIPYKQRRGIKQMLFKCGIRVRTIYPGIEGIAKDLTWLKTNDY